MVLGSLQTGSLVQQNTYDGLNRRIVKAVTNSGDLNCTYHYYYDKDWRVIEERNASNFVLKQMVWAPPGTGYTDELVQVRVNNNLDDPAMSQTMLDLAHPLEMYPGDHWVLQDANYNVLGLVARDGKMVERYEYSPYGERKVFVSAGDNDAGCYAPTLISGGGGRRTMYTMVGGMYDNPVSVPDQPFGLCEFGHQGLMYEEHLNNHLIDVRNRIYNVVLGRWNQTDPYMKDKRLPTAGDRYHDGMNPYEGLRSNPVVKNDPMGLLTGQQISHCASLKQMCLTAGNSVGHCDHNYYECMRNPPQRQDGICSSLAYPLNLSLCARNCCNEHDNCYMKYGCRAGSWLDPKNSPIECKTCCNDPAKRCILRCFGANPETIPYVNLSPYIQNDPFTPTIPFPGAIRPGGLAY